MSTTFQLHAAAHDDDEATGLPANWEPHVPRPVLNDDRDEGLPARFGVYQADARRLGNSDRAVDEAAYYGQLQDWLDAFHDRTARKADAADELFRKRMIAATQKMEEWEEHRQQQRIEEQRRVAEAAARAAEAQRREEEERQARQALSEVEVATAGMTPEARAEWIREAEELAALEREMQQREEKLSDYAQKSEVAYGVYQAKVDAAAAEERAQLEARQRLQMAFDAAQQAERDTVDGEGDAERSGIELDESAAWRAIAHAACEDHARVVDIERRRCYDGLPEADRARLDAMPTAQRNEVLDDLLHIVRLKLRAAGRSRKAAA